MDSDAEETPTDYYYSDEDNDNYYIEAEDNYRSVAEDDDADDPRKTEQNYFFLKESDIRQRQENDITTVSTVLSISKAAATLLLLHYNWRVCEVQDAWFADEDRVRKSVGLLEEPDVGSPKETRGLTCTICFETYPLRGRGITIRSVACGHPFCSECWAKYMSISIHDGPGCLRLRCPDPSCGAAVGRDMIESLASEEDKERYLKYLMRSYIENNKKSKWCPAPGCEYAVEFCGGGAGDYDVCCICSSLFCWNCVEDAHRPVDCGTVAKWVLKNSHEAENVKWILEKTKPCPKCLRPIEKNHGCMHMTCRAPCNHQFCWVCLGPWDKHDQSGYYACNTYQKNHREVSEAASTRERAKRSLERYTHYYERWTSNESSRKQALKDLRQIQTEYVKKLSEVYGETKSQLQFITEAWLQIIECRRVLKWTYAYGYYLPENEIAKKKLFEHLQCQAEYRLEKLHHCAEEDIHEFLEEKSEQFKNFRTKKLHPCAEEDIHEFLEEKSDKFKKFRTKLAEMTTVTKKYFENLVTALENGLEDVQSQEARKLQQANKKEVEGSRTEGRRGKVIEETN